MVDVKQLIKETKSFTNFYWSEFLNLRASGKEFREWLKENYPESYEILTDKTKAERYMNDVIKIIKKEEIQVMGISLHYPRAVVIQ